MNVINKILLSTCLSLSGYSAHAQYSAIVIDADNGKVLQQVAATHAWFPASLTKVMTLYLTFTALKNGQISLFDTAPVSDYAASQPNSKLGLRAGESIQIADAITAVISRSANDAAVVLAERVAGTEAQFANKMTAMARALNMSGSTFFNATGLPNPKQMTTSRDMAILASRIRNDFKDYFHFFSVPYFNFKGRTLPNINSFLKHYDGAQGMKTGFTCASGFNLIAAAERNGRSLIGVVMGAMTRNERTDLMSSLLDQGFAMEDYRGHFYHLTELNNDSYSSPPFQLPAQTCHYEDYSVITRHNNETTPSAQYLATNSKPLLPVNPAPVKPAPIEEKANLSNWTVVLGAFVERAEAEEFNTLVREALNEMANAGYPVVVQHNAEGENLWHALWTGLSSQNQASSVCKHLWEAEIECSILPAEVIASKDAPWR